MEDISKNNQESIYDIESYNFDDTSIPTYDVNNIFKGNEDINIKSNEITRKKPFEFYDVSWKTYRAVSIALLTISVFLIYFVRNLLRKHIGERYLVKAIDILLFFFVLNLGVYLFYKSYYQYISQKKGEKGEKGPQGKKGETGDNDVCDIYEKKNDNFKLEKSVKDRKEIIVSENPPSIDFEKLKSSKKGWHSIGTSNTISSCTDPSITKSVVNITNKVIGVKCADDDECDKSKIQNIRENGKPIIGASVNYNKNTNKIIAIRYLYDKNKTHNPKKYNIANFGMKKENNGTIGDHKNQSAGITRTNFTCPPNSAIYKVEGIYDDNGMAGIKFHCQDIKTGKLVKAYNDKNRKVYGVTFGKEPKPDLQDYKYDKSECRMFEYCDNYYPSFISKIGGKYSNTKTNIQNLEFNDCSVYYNN